jgi:hypothetical protein
MNGKMQVKILADSLMSILLPVLMAWSLIGEKAHEWIGVSMIILFFLHHALNYRWFISIFKGHYTYIRIVQTVLDLILILIMLTLMASGIMLSKYVFTGLSIQSGSAVARVGHMLASHWGFVLMSIHVGMHGNTFVGLFKSKCKAHKTLSILRVPCRIVAIIITSYGVFAFIHRQFPAYMFLKNQFVFMNFDESLALFFADYLAIMVLFSISGYILSTTIRKYTQSSFGGKMVC